MNDCCEQNENDKEVSLRENRNLSEMAREADRLVGELRATRDKVTTFVNVIVDCGKWIIEAQKCIDKTEKTLEEMHVFLAKEAAFGQNCK